jgi:hypothetical protein
MLFSYQKNKGLKPKLHDLTMSMGENKILNQTFARHHIDIHIKFCVGRNYRVSQNICYTFNHP